MLFTKSLRKNFQFRYVYQKGRSIANRHLVLYYIKNNTAQNHLGISVSKKVGKSVVRSHVTRLIRESYRALEPQLRQGFDLVVIARVSCADASYWQVADSLLHLMKKTGMIAKLDNAEKSVKSVNLEKSVSIQSDLKNLKNLKKSEPEKR